MVLLCGWCSCCFDELRLEEGSKPLLCPKKLRKNGIKDSLVKKIKTLAADDKRYLTDFTNIRGVKFLQRHIEFNAYRRKARQEYRRDDEVVNFHPKVMTHLKNMVGILNVPSGNVIDILASSRGNLFTIECKPKPTHEKLFNTIRHVSHRSVS